MLEFIRIQRFKTLLDASFPLSNLNLFTGLNGMGKSSLIQTLLLLRQSYERNILGHKGLLLKGDYLSLGVGQDVLSAQAETNSFEFLIKWAHQEPVKFSFEYAQQSDLQPHLEPLHLDNFGNKSLFNSNFQYLSADRIGPQSAYELSDYHIRDLNSLGNRGEYTVHFIAENSLKNLALPQLRHPNASSDNFLENLNAWMSEITPSVRIHATKTLQINSATLGYAFLQGKELTAEFKPQNVGFGLSFVLPIITAILRAKAGDLLIFENPESHLHPAGQSLMGRLCALAANHGIQLIIESHSDHFLNGVRVAIKQKMIQPNIVRLFFLDRNQENASHSSTVQCPAIDDLGRIDQWPKGFFDEWDRQLEQLL
jgi:predicted ATPase